MVGDSEEVVDGPMGWVIPGYDELRHVQAILRKVDQSILLRLVATEALQVDDEDRWHVVDLDLLDGLLVVHASVAVPCVRLGELLWPIELPEAIVYADPFSELVSRIRCIQCFVS